MLGRMLHGLGHVCVRYRWLVIILWIAAIIAGSIVIGRVGALTNNDLSLPGTGSQAATDLLTKYFPPQENGSSPVGDTSQIAPMQPSTGQKPPPPKPLPIGLPKPDQATRRFRKRSDRAGMRRPRFRNPGAQGLLSRLLYGHQLVQKGLELAPKIWAGQGKGDRCLQKSNL